MKKVYTRFLEIRPTEFIVMLIQTWPDMSNNSVEQTDGERCLAYCNLAAGPQPLPLWWVIA